MLRAPAEAMNCFENGCHSRELLPSPESVVDSLSPLTLFKKITIDPRKRTLLIFEDANSAALRRRLAKVRMPSEGRAEGLNKGRETCGIWSCGPPRGVLPVWEVVYRGRSSDTSGVTPTYPPRCCPPSPPWGYSKSPSSPIVLPSFHGLPGPKNYAVVCKAPT